MTDLIIRPDEVQEPGFELADTGLILRPDLTQEQWAEFGRTLLLRADNRIRWAIGDWMVYGEDRFGEATRNQLAAETGLALQTLANTAYVCRKVPVEVRRPELSFGHHAEVAAENRSAQVRLLADAATNGLSVRALRSLVDQERQDLAPPPDASTDPNPAAAPVTDDGKSGSPPVPDFPEGPTEITVVLEGPPDEAPMRARLAAEIVDQVRVQLDVADARSIVKIRR